MHNDGFVLEAFVDPTCSLPICVEGFQASKMETKFIEVNICVPTIGHQAIIDVERTKKVNTSVTVGDIDLFDTAIYMG